MDRDHILRAIRNRSERGHFSATIPVLSHDLEVSADRLRAEMLGLFLDGYIEQHEHAGRVTYYTLTTKGDSALSTGAVA
jgi:hypothetical protein